MTKERAIDLCHAINQYLCAGNPIWDTAEIHDAMSMAIEALLAKDINVPSNGDVISRQDAIDAIYKESKYANSEVADEYADMFVYAINTLPSAEPSADKCWGCNYPKMRGEEDG